MDVDELFEMGFMPSLAYYQLNGKTANENYRDFRNHKRQELKLSKEIELNITDTINSLLDDLLK